MNPPCARCNKIVYPVEKLSCLDKYWHKACFRCTTCDLALTMKNYKGYSKLPYCTTHYPTTKFTTVTDTPENKRLAQLSQNIGNINYHKDFNADKSLYKGNADVGVMKPQTYDVNDNNAFNKPRLTKNQYQTEPQPTQSYQGQPQLPVAQPMSQNLPNARGSAASTTNNTSTYRCLRDYVANDSDEVSFVKGDIIVEGEVIDDGWMSGRVERTGRMGMLPLIYVENYSYQPEPQTTQSYQRQPQLPVAQPMSQNLPNARGSAASTTNNKPKYRCLYDYEANDNDEVSFMEGDVIVEGEIIDDGWMTGKVERTGNSGMLPFNYVERI